MPSRLSNWDWQNTPTQVINRLQQKYRLLAGLPLQVLKKVHPVLLIDSDYAYQITAIEPVHLGPPGGQAVVPGWDGHY